MGPWDPPKWPMPMRDADGSESHSTGGVTHCPAAISDDGDAEDGKGSGTRSGSGSGSSSHGTTSMQVHKDTEEDAGDEQDECEGCEGQPSKVAEWLNDPNVQMPSLRKDGPVQNVGSVGHPDQCKPCAFYCFSLCGCRMGIDCSYCHMFHESRLRQRREDWKRSQRLKRTKQRASGKGPGEASDAQVHSTSSDSSKPNDNVGANWDEAPHQSRTSTRSGQGNSAEAALLQGISAVQAASLLGQKPGAMPSNLSGLAGVLASLQPSSVEASTLPLLAQLASLSYQPKAAPSPPMPMSRESLQTLQMLLSMSERKPPEPAVNFFSYTPKSVTVNVGQMVEMWPPASHLSWRLIFAISPQLPRGLQLDERSGLLHGRPQVSTNGTSNFYVTACSPGDQMLSVKIAVVTLTVQEAPAGTMHPMVGMVPNQWNIPSVPSTEGPANQYLRTAAASNVAGYASRQVDIGLGNALSAQTQELLLRLQKASEGQSSSSGGLATQRAWV